MTSTLPLLLLISIAGVAIGAAAVYSAMRGALVRASGRAQEAQQARAVAEARVHDQEQRHQMQVETIAQQLKSELHEANARVAEMQRDQFLALAGERFAAAEERANARLTELVNPVTQKLTEFDALVKAMEKDRVGAYEGLKEQISSLVERGGKLELAASALATQTSVLVSALRNPTTRGKWGEVQLRRVVELAGMEAYCDFSEQQTFDAGDTVSRPDLTVALPGNARIFVDAKAPLSAYLDAIEAPDESVRRDRFRSHAVAFKAHVDSLAKKNYQRAEGSADFVVMFVPGEAFLSAACTENPDLIEYGATKGVYISSPLTLMALLRSYALGWQQRVQEENAKKIAEIGRELYDRVRVFLEHLDNVGIALKRSVESYNKAVGSIERSVLPQGRKMKEAAALVNPELPEPNILEVVPREMTALEKARRGGKPARQSALFGVGDETL